MSAFYTVQFRTKNDVFNFVPFLSKEEAMRWYSKLVWEKCIAVRILDGNDNILWETAEPVFPKWEVNPEIGF